MVCPNALRSRKGNCQPMKPQATDAGICLNSFAYNASVRHSDKPSPTSRNTQFKLPSSG